MNFPKLRCDFDVFPLSSVKRPWAYLKNISLSEVAWRSVTLAEKILCEKIGPKLVKDGLYFVGIDVIGGKLVEVNVMSPGGITYINKVSKVKLQEKVIDFLESKVLEKNAAFIRMTNLKRTVDEA